MNSFKKNIYKEKIEGIIVGSCKELLGFTYKGTGDYTIRYILCGDTLYTSHTFIGLPGNGGDEAYYDMTADFDFELGVPCVQEGSAERVSGGSPTVFVANYGSSCTSPPSYYEWLFSNRMTTLEGACGLSSYTLVLFTNTAILAINTVIYVDSGLTVPFVGLSKWIKRESGTSYQVDDDGVIIDIGSCF